MMKFSTMVLSLTAILQVAPPAFAAPPDPCATTMKKVTTSWSKVVRDIDKRTASEASKAGATGEAVYKVAMALLEASAKLARSSGDEADMDAAMRLDDAVTQLKVIVPTAAAIAAWGRANEACDQVKLLAHGDPNTVCEASDGLSGTVKAACSKCNAATAKMLQLADGTPAGEHTIEELIQATVEDIDSLLVGLDDPEFIRSTLSARQKATLAKPLATLKAALQGTVASSREGEAAWEIYDDLRGEMISPALLEKLEKLGKHAKFAKELRSSCRPPEPAGKCEEECRKRGMCDEVSDGRRTECAATGDAGCAASEECRDKGHCKAVDGRCEATSDPQCEASALCRDTGRCTAAKGSCRKGAATSEECRASSGCTSDGECSLHSGNCVVGSAEDCANSTGCRERGYCNPVAPGYTVMTRARAEAELARTNPHFIRCRPLSDEDCERSAGCSKSGNCFYKYGTCIGDWGR